MEIVNEFDVELARVLKRRGSERKKHIEQLKRCFFQALSYDDSDTKTNLRQQLMVMGNNILENQKQLKKTQTALEREKRITKILQDDLAEFRKFRQQDKDKKEKAQKELRELKAKLFSLGQPNISGAQLTYGPSS